MPHHSSNISLTTQSRTLSHQQFRDLAKVPAEVQWLANLDNAQTRRAYRRDIESFLSFTGLADAGTFDKVARTHVLAWRTEMERQGLAGATIRRRLSALASLFEYLCDTDAATHNPSRGIKRPRVESQQGKTPALGIDQARALLNAPDCTTLKGIRDRAILAVLLHHGLRREELCTLKVKDFGHLRSGVPHILVHGKGGKIRYIPVHPYTQVLVARYLEMAGHKADLNGPLFRSTSTAQHARPSNGLTPSGVYANVVRHYMKELGINGDLMGPHALRSTAATCALDNDSDIVEVQEWLGHSNITTTRLYDRRQMRIAASPTYRISY